MIEGANGTAAITNGASDNTKLLLIGGGISGGAAGTTVLTLNGSNTGANTASGVIADGSATHLALVKDGAGTWVLNNASTFSGGTTISNGLLQLGDGTNNGSVAGNIAIAGTGSLAFANGTAQ